MLAKKEFWFAIVLFLLDIFIASSWIHDGYSSFKPCGLLVFTVFGIGFLKQALRR